MMKVGLNTAIKRRGTSGTARVVQYIQRALASSSGIELVNVHPPPRPEGGRLRRALSDARWDLRSAARAVPDIDAFISPCNIGAAPRGIPHILLMHDTMPFDHPEWFDPGYAAYARLLFGYSVRASTQVVTVSRHSARRIEARWPSAAPVEVLRLPAELQVSSPRQMPDGRLQVLMVGATESHKNHVGAIEAVRVARAKSGRDLQLIVVGPAGRAEQRVRQLALTADPAGDWFERRVDLPEQELCAIYETAWVLLQSAFDEGFGLPLLEAAGHGLPIVHTGQGAMNEVVRSGSVGSVHSQELAEGLLELLDESQYTQRSAAVLDDARAHGPTEFRHELVMILKEASGQSNANARTISA